MAMPHATYTYRIPNGEIIPERLINWCDAGNLALTFSSEFPLLFFGSNPVDVLDATALLLRKKRAPFRPTLFLQYGSSVLPLYNATPGSKENICIPVAPNLKFELNACALPVFR